MTEILPIRSQTLINQSIESVSFQNLFWGVNFTDTKYILSDWMLFKIQLNITNCVLVQKNLGGLIRHKLFC